VGNYVKRTVTAMTIYPDRVRRSDRMTIEARKVVDVTLIVL
jgi:hypothetical protein